ncbi:MAG: ShlB/FhaC/HecB family hemolysin secretion/activation protein [Deltaproteobacteria bacterium]|nr:ShlB/FhaC/HecB family hemolysin secretion/activation protein [Deltaproteobacteria bacterium]MBW2692616.1 ShlB/FhaC/HecB family hemolysin secretion/activation protein [Deltaproteobacteria bacterium]
MPRLRWYRNIGPCLTLFIALLLPGERAQGQAIQRPADERPELPEFESPEEAEPILPPIIQPLEPEEAPSTGPGVFIEGYRIVGSTVFSSEELESLVEPWTGRVIRSEDLVSVRNAITEHYVRHGYVNSGATLQDQDFEGGIIEIHIVEGSLSEIRITGNKQFRARYLRDRIRRGATTPLHIGKLEERIQILQQDPRIRKLAARLLPGEQRGESVLHIQVEETDRFGVNLNFSNYEPPSISALGGGVDASLQNIVGWGDSIEAEFTITDGLERYRSRYEIPFTRWDTRLLLEANYANSEITEDPFVDLDIESEFQSYQIGLIQPIYTSTQTRFDLGLIADWRRSNTKLGGFDFSFPGSGAEDGEATASVLRFVADWLHRDQNQVIAARVQLSWGIDVLDATTHNKRDRVDSAQLPDGRFVASLIQLQWARRFGSLGIETIVRGDLQLSNDPLLSLEQIAVGGYATVRGYRQNQRVQDQAAITSLEVRIPIWRDPRHTGVIELAPFVDYARVWDQSGRSNGAQNPENPIPLKDLVKRKAKTLSSVGIGLRWTLPRFLSAQIYWGQNINSVETSGDLQDSGVQFLITCRFP